MSTQTILSADIRAAIIKCLKTVPETGNIYAFEPYAKQQSGMLELYQFKNRVQGWNLKRGTNKKTQLGIGLFEVRTSWNVTGYMSLNHDDETELLFDALYEQIQRKLSLDPKFGIANNVPNYEIKAIPDTVMFFGVLCHSVVITFDTMHNETTTPEDVSQHVGQLKTVEMQVDISPHVSTAEHEKWLEEPHDHRGSSPDLTQLITFENEEEK